jgi:hypothetical protein
MTRIRALPGALLALALPTLFAACPGPPLQPKAEFDKGSIFTADDSGKPDNLRRDFECLQKDPHGECVQRKCTQAPGGESFDCATYARDCVIAGYHWSGTKESGVCTEIL